MARNGVVIRHNLDRVLVDALKRAPQRVTRAVDRTLARGALEVANEAKQRAPQGRGNLARSIISRQVAPLRHEVDVGAQYGADVELGTRGGGLPPVESLTEWVRIKGITPRNPAIESREELVRLLQFSIFQRGTKAQPFLRPAVKAKRSRLAELVAAGAGEGLRDAGL